MPKVGATRVSHMRMVQYIVLFIKQIKWCIIRYRGEGLLLHNNDSIFGFQSHLLHLPIAWVIKLSVFFYICVTEITLSQSVPLPDLLANAFFGHLILIFLISKFALHNAFSPGKYLHFHLLYSMVPRVSFYIYGVATVYNSS